jgi:hypothetical protein
MGEYVVNDNNMHAALMALFLALMGAAALSYRDAGSSGRHRMDHPATRPIASVRMLPVSAGG